MNAAAKAVERAARESFGRLVAFVASRSGDVAGAEDALADAVASALTRWPIDGVPDNPEAWLLTAARRRLTDRYRHTAVQEAAAMRLRMAQEEAEAMASEPGHFPDERLKLLFACAHPAIESSVRTPLMLQTVLGLDAGRVASAFLVSPDAMTKRLTRAKLRIREAGVPFALPMADDLPARISDVLAAVYAAFTLGSNDPGDGVGNQEALADEAIWLGRVVIGLLPDDVEAQGLLALMLFSRAREDARRDASGAYVPLTAQNSALWNETMMVEAEHRLRNAGQCARPGRYQLEAAIQAVHVDRRRTGRIDWQAIVRLYDGLILLSPAIGAEVARAAAICEAGDVVASLMALDAVHSARVEAYQPYWATRAHVLHALGRPTDAAMALTRAAGLTEDAAVRAYLLAKRTQLAQ